MLKVYINNNQVELKTIKFSGGEIQPKLPPSKLANWDEFDQVRNKAKILALLRNSDDIMELLMVTDAIRREYDDIEIHLTMPYVPYARQDRVCDKGEALAIKVFADLINSQNYNSVTVWDPHSDVTPSLLDRCKILKQAEIVVGAHTWNRMKPVGKDTVLVSPDAGANKKTFEVAHILRSETVVRADKIRDVKTGAILETKVYSEHIGERDFLIVDDICDGGRTFIELAKVLRPLTNGEIFLYVTHGIFSQGFTKLLEHIDHIFVANSFVEIHESAQPFVTNFNPNFL